MTAPQATRFPISDHCDGVRFFNPRVHFKNSFLQLLRWKLANSATRWPEHVTVTPGRPGPAPTDDRIVATWVNHATFLLQTRYGNVLTDPVWSDRVGPGSLGPRRVHPPGIAFFDLPKIDTVLLSHDHYDHCDVVTLRRLAERHRPVVFAPLGHRELLRGAGFATERIVELDWWEAPPLAAPGESRSGTLSVTLTPSRHWSNRLTGPTNGRLWGGFFIRAGDASVWFAGDTAYDPEFFPAIRTRLGAPRLALIPIGAYEPRWFMAPVHCNPAEAVQIHCDVGARQSIGMHWGTFQLTDEGRDAPPTALAEAVRARSLRAEEFRVIAPGEQVVG